MKISLGFQNRQRRAGGNPWGDDFVFTVQTTGTPETFTIPCANIGTYNAVINWGDGTANSVITAYNDADLAHSYATPGTYLIRISGTFPQIYFNNTGDRLKIKTVEQMGRVGWAGINLSFYGCGNMTKFVAGNHDFDGTRNLYGTFRSCTSLVTLDLSTWIGRVKPNSLINTFYSASALVTLDLSWMAFDANTSMSGAFRGMSALTSLLLPDNAVTTLCTSTSNMFYQTGGLDTLNTTGWDTSAITSFAGMFRSVGSIDVDISHFRFNAATDVSLFMNGTTLTTAQYDAALIEWDGIDAPNSLSFDFGTSKYTGGGAAEAARAALVATDLWVITDGGIA